jgi:DNA-binding NarL/FixJ family response regulator
MKIRLVIATADAESHDLLHTLLDAALQIVPFQVETRDVNTLEELSRRNSAHLDDLLLFDWQLADSDTPNYLRELAAINPNLRMITILPLHLRQYRQCLWDAGACTSIPKENMDQEWLASVLCLIHRAMEREERLKQSLTRN